MNKIEHNGRFFEVWMQDSHRKNGELACIYDVTDGDKPKEPIISTAFGNMASFENQIMPWAKNALKRYFENQN